MQTYRGLLIIAALTGAFLLGTTMFAYQRKPEPSPAQNAQSPPGQSSSQPPVTQIKPPVSLPVGTRLVSTMHNVNQMAIEAGKLAQSNSKDYQIRAYGQLLVRDHTVADRMLTQYARVQNIPLPPPPPPTEQAPQSPQAFLERLQGLQGRQFDQQFLQFMQQGDEHAVTMLAREELTLPVSQLKNMLNQIIPILSQHYEIASTLRIRQSAQGLAGGY